MTINHYLFSTSQISLFAFSLTISEGKTGGIRQRAEALPDYFFRLDNVILMRLSLSNLEMT